MTKYLLMVIFVVITHATFSQRMTISGIVRDATNGELLAGAIVQDSLSQTGVPTNAYGFFSLEIPAGDHPLKISFVGYESLYINGVAKHKSPCKSN